MALVTTEGLCKSFDSIKAVDGISLTVEAGEILGFLGPNGAGKSTTMKMITGFIEPDAGRSVVCGIDMAERPKAAKQHIGYLPEGAPAYGDMSPSGFLKFVGQIRGLRRGQLTEKVDAAISKTGLEKVVDQTIDTLSKGFKRRVGLAQAILHEPDVLILDEPTDGLDPNQKHHIRELIKTMASKKAIVISTHILEEVEAVCTRAVVIDKGRIVADGTAEDLQGRAPYHNAVSIRLAATAANSLADALKGNDRIDKVETIATENGTAHLRAFPKSELQIAADVAAIVKDSQISVEEIFVERGRLDDVFRQITTTESGASHAQ